MLEAKDLRIGNLVKDPLGREGVITELGKKNVRLKLEFSTVKIDTDHDKQGVDVSGIYLTTYVLSKYGELVNKVSGTFRIDLPTRAEVLFLSLKEVGNGKPYIVDLFSFGTSKTIRMVHYLHEIQNIFYCLTGNEMQPVSDK